MPGAMKSILRMEAAGGQIFTKGRPPWFDSGGQMAQAPLVIGICGGSASGKTTVAEVPSTSTNPLAADEGRRCRR